MAVEIASSVLLIVGVAFMFVAALGLVRLPDLFMRMSGATKAATLGVGCTLLGAAIYFGDFVVTIRVVGIIVFIFLTAPVSAHMLSRAAYCVGVMLSDKTIVDDLDGRYELSADRRRLESCTPPLSPPETHDKTQA